MSTKYLGEHFDIHGGGMDLLFPHHESEVCQSTVVNGKESVKYWMHNNMITINGQKMGKSLGNFITLNQFFSGDHPLLERAYAPMTIRYFILQAHYRGTVDFSNEALLAAEKGLQKLYAAEKLLDNLQAKEKSDENISDWKQRCYDAMNDDMNTPRLIAELFDAVRIINSVKDNHLALTKEDIELLKTNFRLFFFEILGLLPDDNNEGNSEITEGLMDLIIEIRREAKLNKNWAVADTIRNQLAALGISIKDTKEGAVWER
jgi:cysteinyl-tRNA synthetase